MHRVFQCIDNVGRKFGRSWLAALRGDLLWLTDVAGSDWGTWFSGPRMIGGLALY